MRLEVDSDGNSPIGALSACFDSKLVRLEEILIKKGIPYQILGFRFQTGAIRSFSSVAIAFYDYAGFDSKLVRLEVPTRRRARV